jgi:anti-sigma factor RsiW
MVEGLHPDFDVLDDYFENRLPEKIRAEIGRHLESCEACRENLTAIEAASSDARILIFPGKSPDARSRNKLHARDAATSMRPEHKIALAASSDESRSAERLLPDPESDREPLWEDQSSRGDLFRSKGNISIAIFSQDGAEVGIVGKSATGRALDFTKRMRLKETVVSFKCDKARFPVSLSFTVGETPLRTIILKG